MEIEPSAEIIGCLSVVITVTLFRNVLLCVITGKKICTVYIPVLAIDRTKMAVPLQESILYLPILSKTTTVTRKSGGFSLVFNK